MLKFFLFTYEVLLKIVIIMSTDSLSLLIGFIPKGDLVRNFKDSCLYMYFITENLLPKSVYYFWLYFNTIQVKILKWIFTAQNAKDLRGHQ